MATESPLGRTSFFDDDDISTQFKFYPPNKSHQKSIHKAAIMKSTLVHKTKTTTETGTFTLQNRLVCCYKDQKSPDCVLDVYYARLGTVTDSNNRRGFSITKNLNVHEFFSDDNEVIDNWLEALRKVCVLTSFHEDFKALKMIGKGSFAKVYLVESKTTGKSFAVKAFTKDGVIASNKSNAKPSMFNEIDIMRVLDHDNIIKLHEVYETEKSIYLVLDLIQGKPLQEALKRPNFKEEYSEVKVFNMIRSILDALAYLASKGIMHRDLKPDNILLERNEKIKIVDFGLATYINASDYIFKKCGTPGYIAPEVFKYDAKDQLTFYDDHCDVFSAGCILFYLLHGKAYFEGHNGSEILKTNRKFIADQSTITTLHQRLHSSGNRVSNDAVDLLAKLLEFNQSKRISANDSLNHSYFTPFPLGMTRISSSNQYMMEPLSKYNLSGSYSPRTASPTSASLPSPEILERHKSDSKSPNSQSPITAMPKDRFAERGSLFLDMGRPELNGRVDTVALGSTNNSILVANNRRSSDAGLSPLTSAFANKSPEPKGRDRGKSLRVANNFGSQSILKAAIFRNMQKNNEYDPGNDKEAISPDDIDVNREFLSARPRGDQESRNSSVNYENSFEQNSSLNISPGHKPQTSPVRRFQPFAK